MHEKTIIPLISWHTADANIFDAKYEIAPTIPKPKNILKVSFNCSCICIPNNL